MTKLVQGELLMSLSSLKLPPRHWGMAKPSSAVKYYMSHGPSCRAKMFTIHVFMATFKYHVEIFDSAPLSSGIEKATWNN